MADIEEIADRAERGEDISAHMPKVFVAKYPITLHVPEASARAWEALSVEQRDTLTGAVVQALQRHGSGGLLILEEDPLLFRCAEQKARMARAHLQVLIGRFSDADALALWEMIMGWCRPKEPDDARR
jgi:hypothetical protein